MKAVSRTTYGPPEILEVVDLDPPVPKADEVLIRIHATSINASDLELLTATPAYGRFTGLIRPRARVLGSDLAGVVEVVGSQVTRFVRGDAVFGDIFETFGGFAEQVCAPQDKLTKKPAGLTFEQAAAMPQSGLIAQQALCDVGHLQAGQRVLINGAGGGGGSFAVQIAKEIGAEVTAVDSAEKLELAGALGADRVVDFKLADVTRGGVRFHLILDLAGHHLMREYRRVLEPGGRYLLVGGPMRNVLPAALLGPIISLLSSTKMGLLLHRPNQGLDRLIARVESGSITPAIDRVFPLVETAAALRYFADGHAKGKVVIAVR
ncbi:MAG: NAD(P)-dependent alcohol dehydrogenase [bacterium]|nr:NAD(P)-dependent alcohol dehydrogenase [bacterium]